MVTRHRVWPRFAALLLAGVVGCENLEVVNPNAPERERAFSDPATIVASAAGTMKSYINMRGSYDPSLTLSVMADSYSFSWNNFNGRYYSTYGVECPDRCGWVNSTASGLGFEVESYWYKSYSMLSSANDALFAIRVSANPPNLGSDANVTETISQFAQGWALAWIALNYDQGFIVLEDTDISDPSAIPLSAREEIRDKAIELLEAAYTLAKANTFTTSVSMFGISGGRPYSNLQIAKVIRTAQAELLAHFARNDVENGQTNWAQVATYASQGVSSDVDGAAFDFEAFQDVNTTFRSQYLWWGNDYTTARIDTRTATLLSTSQVTPWPGGTGNPQPVGVGGVYGIDARLGDGCFDDGTGEADLFGYGECAETANSGTDFMWSPVAIFIPGRGAQHQTNIGSIKHRAIVGGFPSNPPGDGFFPVYSKHFNDLLWAEGLVRTSANLALAADLINRSHVGRGGLPALTAADGQTNLLKAIAYEQDVELLHHPPTQFYNLRRVSKAELDPTGGGVAFQANRVHAPEGPHVLRTLWANTPRHMPIPAKDLQLLLMEIYTFGGPNDPDGLSSPVDSRFGKVKSVHQIAAELDKQATASAGGRFKRRYH